MSLIQAQLPRNALWLQLLLEGTGMGREGGPNFAMKIGNVPLEVMKMEKSQIFSVESNPFGVQRHMAYLEMGISTPARRRPNNEDRMMGLFGIDRFTYLQPPKHQEKISELG